MYLKCIGLLLGVFLYFRIFYQTLAEKPLKCIVVDIGIASWYGPGFQGKKTASGDIFDMNLLTAAHKNLEFGTLIRVTNLRNLKHVIVEINDRGPVSKNKLLDISKKAAQEIDIIKAGSVNVKIEIIGYKQVNFKTLLKHFRNIQIIRYGKIIF